MEARGRRPRRRIVTTDAHRHWIPACAGMTS